MMESRDECGASRWRALVVDDDDEDDDDDEEADEEELTLTTRTHAAATRAATMGVGDSARGLSARRRARAGGGGGGGQRRTSASATETSEATLEGFEDPLGFGTMDAGTLAARVGGGASVRERCALGGAKFDARTYARAAYGTRTTAELREGLERARMRDRDAERARKAVVGENLPSYLACLDATEDARELLKKAREDRGEFGVAAELEARLRRVGESARTSLGTVFALEKKRAQIVRVLGVIARHPNIFGAPATAREALSRGDFAYAATLCREAHVSFGGQNSKVLDIVLQELLDDIKAAEERLCERIYVDDLDDAKAESVIVALRQLQCCKPYVDTSARVPDVLWVYIDRLVESACYALTNVTISDSTSEYDEEALGRTFREHFFRVWRFAMLSDVGNAPRAQRSMASIQIRYVELLQSRFDDALYNRLDQATDVDVSRTSRRFDVLMDKCDKMVQIGVSLSHTYDVLRTRLDLPPDLFGPLQQQNTRITVSLRVHLEQAIKLASPTLAEFARSPSIDAYQNDMLRIFRAASNYWCNEKLTPQMVAENARDSTALIAFFETACRNLRERCLECKSFADESCSPLIQLEVAARVCRTTFPRLFQSFSTP